MNNNYDRGMLKWSPFNSLVPLSTIKKTLIAERKTVSYPILSEDELTTLENNLLLAYHSQEEVLITYFYHNNLYQLKGTIAAINAPNKQIILNKTTKLYFNQIIKISIIEQKVKSNN